MFEDTKPILTNRHFNDLLYSTYLKNNFMTDLTTDLTANIETIVSHHAVSVL